MLKKNIIQIYNISLFFGVEVGVGVLYYVEIDELNI